MNHDEGAVRRDHSPTHLDLQVSLNSYLFGVGALLSSGEPVYVLQFYFAVFTFFLSDYETVMLTATSRQCGAVAVHGGPSVLGFVAITIVVLNTGWQIGFSSRLWMRRTSRTSTLTFVGCAGHSNAFFAMLLVLSTSCVMNRGLPDDDLLACRLHLSLSWTYIL